MFILLFFLENERNRLINLSINKEGKGKKNKDEIKIDKLIGK
jgi:hypothetical protein